MSLDDVSQFMKFYLDNLNNIDLESEKLDLTIEGKYLTFNTIIVV